MTLKLTKNGSPDVATDSSQWQSMLFGAVRDVGVVLADNLTQQDEETRARAPFAEDKVPWYKQPAVLIGGGIGVVLILVLLLRRR